jgi:very-short-patch-repair endonuclease
MRQKPIDNYIIDFYCSKLRLAIEIDGKSHDGIEIKDNNRQRDIEKVGISFLRFPDIEVKMNIDGVLKTIRKYIEELG